MGRSVENIWLKTIFFEKFNFSKKTIMKKTKIFAAIGGVGLAVLAIFLIAADHIDSPSVAGTTTDIADLYAFEGSNPDNTVLIATVQGPLTPGDVTNNATFDENVLLEFNIDNTGDFKEDLVIQAIKRGDRPKIVLEKSMAQHTQMCVENSEDIMDARNLAELLSDQIAYRIRIYSYSICKSTDNYLKWLKEDYERKLKQSLSPHFIID